MSPSQGEDDEAPSATTTTAAPYTQSRLRVDQSIPFSRPSIVLTTPESTQPVLPTSSVHATLLAQHCAPLESELLHQVTLLKTRLRTLKSGPEFWRVLAKGLSQLLDAQYVSISKRLDTVPSNTGSPPAPD